jgi:hypothetical protein
LAAFGLAGAQQPEKQQQGGASAKAAEHALPASPEATYKPYPNRYAGTCYGAKQHDAADLCAQWRAAVATEKAAHEARRATTWAIAATFLSLATVVGLIVTIWQTFGALGEARRGNLIAQRANARATRQAIHAAADTKEALKIARRNATAANALAKGSERAAKVQLRPYLAVYSLDIEEPEMKPEGRWCTVNLKLTNNGQTPAIVTRFFVQMDWHAGDMFTCLSVVEKKTKFLVHNRKEPTNIPLPMRAHGEGLKELGQLIGFVCVDYTDVFKQEHSEVSCFQTGDTARTTFFRLDFPLVMNHFPLPDYMDLLGLDEDGKPKSDGEAEQGLAPK